MSDRRSRILADTVLDVSVPDPEWGVEGGWEAHLVTSIEYHSGGTNWLSGNQSPRGYYVTVRLVERKDNAERFTMFSGTSIKSLLLPASAFSAKKLATLTVDDAKVASLRAHVLSKREEERQRVLCRREEHRARRSA